MRVERTLTPEGGKSAGAEDVTQGIRQRKLVPGRKAGEGRGGEGEAE